MEKIETTTMREGNKEGEPVIVDSEKKWTGSKTVEEIKKIAEKLMWLTKGYDVKTDDKKKTEEIKETISEFRELIKKYKVDLEKGKAVIERMKNINSSVEAIIEKMTEIKNNDQEREKSFNDLRKWADELSLETKLETEKEENNRKLISELENNLNEMEKELDGNNL